MCTSYESNEDERSEAFTLFLPHSFEYRREIYKDYLAPIFRRGADGFPVPLCEGRAVVVAEIRGSETRTIRQSMQHELAPKIT